MTMQSKLAAVVVLLATGVSMAQECDPRRTLVVDAVELIAGREVKGDPAFAVQRGAYTYQFANAANKAAFEKSPDKYEFQFGGACARMGPLSGAGSAGIYAVHNGKLYAFASEQCKAAFLKAPEKLLEADDPRPEADASAQKRGRELLELAVNAAGGAARIDGVNSYRQTIEKIEESGGKKYNTANSLTIAFPDRFRIDESWGDSSWGEAVSKDRGFFLGNDDRGSLCPEQVRAVKRIVNRNPLVILKARNQPGFFAAAQGEGKVGDAKVERVVVAFDGTTTTLGIDPATGRILSITHPGRGPRLTLGIMDKSISESKTIDGVTLPWTWRVSFDGDVGAAVDVALTRLEINPALADGVFMQPTVPAK